MEWLSAAACRQHDPELFFPLAEIGPGKAQVEKAKAVCAQCPVASACLAWALDLSFSHGIWGGTTESERAGLSRRQRTESPTPLASSTA